MDRKTTTVDRILDTGECLDWLDAKRVEVITIARKEIGDHVKGSVRVCAYWSDVLPDASTAQVTQAARDLQWCGAFALWCYHRAGLASHTPWMLGTGFAWRLPRTTTPERGDLLVIPDPYWHHAIFDRAEDDTIVSVDGNQPGVRERRRVAPKAIYYSIRPWLETALEAL